MMTTGPAAISTTVLQLAQANRFDEILGMYAPNLRPMLTPESLRAAWNAEIERYGAVTTVGGPVSDPAGPAGTLVRTPVVFTTGQVTMLASVTASGWITDIRFTGADAARPAERWQPPNYADPGAFDEQDVAIGSGHRTVEGTLALPRTPGLHPAVVLLP